MISSGAIDKESTIVVDHTIRWLGYDFLPKNSYGTGSWNCFGLYLVRNISWKQMNCGRCRRADNGDRLLSQENARSSLIDALSIDRSLGSVICEQNGQHWSCFFHLYVHEVSTNTVSTEKNRLDRVSLDNTCRISGCPFWLMFGIFIVKICARKAAHQFQQCTNPYSGASLETITVDSDVQSKLFEKFGLGPTVTDNTTSKNDYLLYVSFNMNYLKYSA